jgi:dTMP kinase
LCKYTQEIYRQHIHTFNGGKEIDDGRYEISGTTHNKRSTDDFVKHFNALIHSFKVNGFDSRFPIPIGTNLCLENGVHRLALCYIHNILPEYNYLDKVSQKYPEQMFNNLDLEYRNSMCLEACMDRTDLSLLTVFPVSDPSKHAQVEKYLESSGVILAERSITLTDIGLFNYVKECYRGEDWASDVGIKGKAMKCAGPPGRNTKVYLFYSNIPLQALKDDMRKMYGVRDSVHVHDTQEQKMRLAKIVFHKNTFDFHNSITPKLSLKNETHLNNYRYMIQSRLENFAIDSSFIMSMYNLREANDLDYISYKGFKIEAPGIDCHNKHFRIYNKTPTKVVIEDERNWFYYHGMKFLNLSFVEDMKTKRSEGKDMRDLELIRSATKKCPTDSSKKRGIFFVFEGPDNSGKTTHINMTVKALRKANVLCERLRFPNRSTRIGKLLDCYLQGETSFDSHTVQLLFAANRREMQTQIKSLLHKGIHIFCDRYFLSGLAYSDLDAGWCKNLDSGNIHPDITFLFHPIFMQNDKSELYHTIEKQTRVWNKFQSFDQSHIIQVPVGELHYRHSQVVDTVNNIVNNYKDGPLCFI